MREKICADWSGAVEDLIIDCEVVRVRGIFRKICDEHSQAIFDAVVWNRETVLYFGGVWVDGVDVGRVWGVAAHKQSEGVSKEGCVRTDSSLVEGLGGEVTGESLPLSVDLLDNDCALVVDIHHVVLADDFGKVQDAVGWLRFCVVLEEVRLIVDVRGDSVGSSRRDRVARLTKVEVVCEVKVDDVVLKHRASPQVRARGNGGQRAC